MRVWGMGYWRLKFEPNKIPTYNLINVSATAAPAPATANIADRHHVNNSSSSSGSSANTDIANTAIRIQPTKYFDILKNTVPKARAILHN
jgi:hypothetical protein